MMFSSSYSFHELPHPLYVDDNFTPPVPQEMERESSSEQPQQAKPRILVVDDQRLIADTLCEILESAGFQAAAAYDAWTALEIVTRFQPNYLLSDVLMPHMNGVELAIALRTKIPSLKILLFSGQAGISDILEDGKRRGHEFELIAKPVHPLKLIERLKSSE